MSRYEKVDVTGGGGGGRVFFCMRCTSLHLMHLTAPQFSGFCGGGGGGGGGRVFSA